MTSGQKTRANLSLPQKALLILSALLIAALVAYYIAEPPVTTKTTTERNGRHAVVKVVEEKETKVGDAIILGGLGSAVILALTALLDGRLKLTGPGGAGVEVLAITAAADATIAPLATENERLRAQIAALQRVETPEPAPEVQAALRRWQDVEAYVKNRPAH